MTNCVIISVSLLSVVTVRDFQDGRHVAMNISQHQCVLLNSPHDDTTMPTNACACGGDNLHNNRHVQYWVLLT